VHLCTRRQGVKSFIVSGRLLELTKSFQCMNSCRQVAKDFCKEKGIPLKEAMVMLDTDYVSEVQSCGSDINLSADITDRCMKAGLGEKVNKVTGFEWRSPDVSEEHILFICQILTQSSSMWPFFAG
jgi:hypothetical protein